MYLIFLILHKYIMNRREILGVKEGEIMNKMSFLKGLGVGAAMGAAMGMIAMPKQKKFRIGEALKSMGDVVNNVAGTLGL